MNHDHTVTTPVDGDKSSHRTSEPSPAERLLAELESLDILLEIEGAQLALTPPKGEISRELLARVRDHKPGLMELVRSGTMPEILATSEPAEDGVRTSASPPDNSLLCPWCGPEMLQDATEGLQCSRCSRIAWIEGPDGSLTRADMLGVDSDSVSPDDVAQCKSCGDLCDTLTGMDVWACSRCDPSAASRREATSRLMDLRQRLMEPRRIRPRMPGA